MIRKLFFSLAAVFLLGGCNGNETTLNEPIEYVDELLFNLEQTLQDGIYFALEDDFDEIGWKRFVEIQVIDNAIADVSFDAVHMFAATLKAAASYNEIDVFDDGDMEHQLRWDEQMALLESFIMDYQKLPSAPSSALEPFTLDLSLYGDLVAAALAQGPVAAGPYLDGRYFMEQAILEGEDDTYRYFLHMIVRHGYIIAVHWNAINDEGIRKYEPLLHGSILDTEDEAVIWRAQADLMEAHLIRTQDPTLMTFDEEEMSQELFGVDIPIQSFIELAVSSLAAGPILENN